MALWLRAAAAAAARLLPPPAPRLHLASMARQLTTMRQRRPMANPWAALAAFGIAVGTGGSIAWCKSSAAPPKVERNPALSRAVLVGDIDTLQRLIKAGHSPDTRHPLGWTPLHVAAVNGNLRLCKELLSQGADPDLEDLYSIQDVVGRGNTAHIIDVVRTRSAEFSRRIHPQNNTKGFTGLMYAVLVDDLEIVKALLEAGADPTRKNEDGRKAADYCDVGATPNSEQIARLLEQAETVYALKKEEEEKELRRKFPLEARIRERLVGQRSAIKTVAASIRRKENGWQDEDHPLVFLFMGSSGIGKTETAKLVAEYLHPNNPQAFIRLDMSEYASKHEAARFIGSPPGYVGHEQGGQLTERLKACPDAVVLLGQVCATNEVEKSHPDVLTVMLQLFDEGRLTDGKGQTIECKDAIFIMTSNLAQTEIAEYALMLAEAREGRVSNAPNPEAEDFEVSRHFRDTVIRPILRQHFNRDEFLGRINEIVFFLPFSQHELKDLVRLELNRWREKASSRHGIDLQFSDDVPAFIARGYDVHYGARSIKYECDRRIINTLAAMWEAGTLKRNSKVHISVEGDRIKIDVADQGSDATGLLGLLKR